MRDVFRSYLRLLINYVNEGLTDHAILQSCFGMGHRRTEDEIHMWNEFMRKRGWNDELTASSKTRRKNRDAFSLGNPDHVSVYRCRIQGG